MDPTNNLVPGIDPNELAAAAEAEANALPEANPAADIANAAMAGAEPIVTTTDLNATDVAPEPTLQMPTPESEVPTTPAAEAPAEGPVSLAPSADFQMGEVSTVSAVQNGADGNLAAANEEVLIGQPLDNEQPLDSSQPEAQTQPEAPADDLEGEQSSTPSAADFNDPEAAAAAEAAAAKKDEEVNDEPIIAAAPVPGSIGSAKSYADIQRAEAAKAAKVAAKQGQKGKLSKNTIILIAVAAVVLVGVIIAVVMMMGGSSSSTPTRTGAVIPASDDDDEEHDLSTLSCKRPLATEEFISYNAVSGTYENIFYFKDDELDGLVTNFAYTYDDENLAKLYRNQFMQSFGVTVEQRAGKDNEKKTDEDSEDADETEEPSTTKTTAEMLKHYVALDKLTVIHGMEIKSEDIAAWLASDAYSDRTYGATEKSGEETTEPTRNLDYYKTIQNSIDFTCEITKGY